MIDYYFKTPDFNTFKAQFSEYWDVDVKEFKLPKGLDFDLDIPIVITPAVFDVDGETIITPAVISTDYHANVRCRIDGVSYKDNAYCTGWYDYDTGERKTPPNTAQRTWI